jgi:hypothetical protein
MDWQTLIVLALSTLGLVLIGYVVLTTLLRALNRPGLLLPWKRRAKIAELHALGSRLLRERLTAEDHLAVERAMNTLEIPGTETLTGPWSRSDPIVDAERDILAVQARVEKRASEAERADTRP